MLPEFELIMPATLDEALTILENRRDAAPIAGGTNLIVDMRGKRHAPSLVVDIGKIQELNFIQIEDGWLRIGSGCSISNILASDFIGQYAPVLHEAAQVFANPLIRNRATLGGNLTDASPASDMAPPLMVMDAEVELRSKTGKRILPLWDYFVGVRKTRLEPTELLSAVRLPIHCGDSRAGFYKLGLRKADAIAVASAAVRLDLSPGGSIDKARIALGSVAPTPVRAMLAENFLVGKIPTQENIAQAGKLAIQAANPISDLRASAEYRRKMVAVLVQKLLERLAHGGNRREK